MKVLQRYEQMFRSLAPENLKAQLKRTKGTLGDGAINIILASIISSIILLGMGVFQMAIVGTTSMVGDAPFETALISGMSSTLIILIAIISPILMVISSLIVTGVMWAVAKLLGGKGTFTQQFFQFSYPMGGIVIISSVVGLVPCIGDLISIALSLYSLYIAFEIYRSVHKLDDARAILLVALPIILFILAIILIVVLFAGVIASIIAGGAASGAYYS